MTRTAWAWGLSAIFGLCGVSAAADSYQRGVTAYFARDYAGAEAALEESVTSSADPRGWYFKGLAERALNKHAEAQESIHQGASLLAAGHGDMTTVRRSLERVQGPVRAYLESVQSFYATTYETPDHVIAAGPSPAEEFSQFVSTLGADQDGARIEQVAAPDVVPPVAAPAPDYPMPAAAPAPVPAATATSGVVTTTSSGSTVSYGYDGNCGGWGGYDSCGWGGCRPHRCGLWRARIGLRCGEGGGWGCGGSSWGCGVNSGSVGCGSYAVGGCGDTIGCGDAGSCGGWSRGCGLGLGRFRSRGCW